MSPTSNVNPGLVLSAASPVDIPISQNTENLITDHNLNNGIKNCNNSATLSTTPTKSETSTPINSRFIIKKIAQSELEKYISSPINTNKKLTSQQESKNSISQQSVQESDQKLDIKNDQSIIESNAEPTERLINKFTVKKVNSQDLYSLDESKVQFANQKLKEDVKQEGQQNMVHSDEEKAKQMQANNEVNKQQQHLDQKNLIQSDKQASRTNSMSEKSMLNNQNLTI